MMDENEQSTVETVTEKAGEAASAVGTGAKKVVSAVAENPVLAAAGAAAVGAAVGGTALARDKKKKASASSKKRQPAKKSSAKTATRRSPAKKSTAKKSTAKKSTAEEVDDTRGGFKVEDPQAHGEVHHQEVNGGQEDLFFQMIATG